MGVYFLGSGKVFWNAFIEPNVKEYLRHKCGLSASDCMYQFYDYKKSQELTELQQEIKNLENLLTKKRELLTIRENELTKREVILTNDKLAQKVLNWSKPEIMIGKYIEHPINKGEKILIDKELILKYIPDFKLKEDSK